MSRIVTHVFVLLFVCFICAVGRFCIAAEAKGALLYKLDDGGFADMLEVQSPALLAATAARHAQEVKRVRLAAAKQDSASMARAKRIPQAGLGSGKMTAFLNRLERFTPRMFVQTCVLGGCVR
mgnify:CR=1 FL=1